jgi:hypothetical protein
VFAYIEVFYNRKRRDAEITSSLAGSVLLMFERKRIASLAPSGQAQLGFIEKLTLMEGQARSAAA